MIRDIRPATIALVGLLLLASLAVPGSVVAQTTETENASDVAPIYDGVSTETNSGAWTADNEEPTLDALFTYASRIGTFVIGSGTSPSTGPLLVGVLLMGGVAGVAVGAGVGTVGGSVLIVSGMFAAVESGIAPSWGFAVLMFGVGLILASVARRVLG